MFSKGPAVITKPTPLTGKSSKRKKEKKVIALFDLDFKEQSTSSLAKETNPGAFSFSTSQYGRTYPIICKG